MRLEDVPEEIYIPLREFGSHTNEGSTLNENIQEQNSQESQSKKKVIDFSNYYHFYKNYITLLNHGEVGNTVYIWDKCIVFKRTAHLITPEFLHLFTQQLSKSTDQSDSDSNKEIVQYETPTLPNPKPYNEPYFDVTMYASEMYADAQNLSEAIAKRGQKDFFNRLTPEDFDELPPYAERLGIVTLLAQFTWDNINTSRDTRSEQQITQLQTGDILILSPIVPADIDRSSQNMLEIKDSGYGFFTTGGALLPLTAFSDFNEQQIVNEILKCNTNEVLIATIRDLSCFGSDGIEQDPDFFWRMYTIDATLIKLKFKPE